MATTAFYVGQNDYLSKLNVLYESSVTGGRSLFSIGANSTTASITGGITYNSTSGVFTYIPKINELPTQLNNSGKYLTTNGRSFSKYISICEQRLVHLIKYPKFFKENSP